MQEAEAMMATSVQTLRRLTEEKLVRQQDAAFAYMQMALVLVIAGLDPSAAVAQALLDDEKEEGLPGRIAVSFLGRMLLRTLGSIGGGGASVAGHHWENWVCALLQAGWNTLKQDDSKWDERQRWREALRKAQSLVESKNDAFVLPPESCLDDRLIMKQQEDELWIMLQGLGPRSSTHRYSKLDPKKHDVRPESYGDPSSCRIPVLQISAIS
eukprot:COSAG01_NODE_17_length_39991_cov_30.596160_9_plen_212_part_00